MSAGRERALRCSVRGCGRTARAWLGRNPICRACRQRVTTATRTALQQARDEAQRRMRAYGTFVGREQAQEEAALRRMHGEAPVPCPVHGRTRAMRTREGTTVYRCCGQLVPDPGADGKITQEVVGRRKRQ